MERALLDGSLRATGPALSQLLPPVSRFAPNDAYGEVKGRVRARLAAFLERFSGLVGSGAEEPHD